MHLTLSFRLGVVDMEKVIVEVYDNCEISDNWFTYPSDYEPVNAREKFPELKEILLKEFGEDMVEVVYIDITDMNINDFPEVSRVINYGHDYPVIVINGRARFAGVMNYENIINVIKEELNA